ncbi:MAG TPA: glycosyltransferase [Acidimicrobiales bacterium]
MTLPTPARPRVSVVILGYRHARLLHRGLAALARHRTRVDYETVVVLNGADDQVCSVVDDGVRGAVVVRSSVNLGFGGGCNRGVRASRGEYVVLLNDDTEVEDGWLDALVDTADRHPEAGAVGSRVRDPYGKLQEAGGILWKDGSIWHVGRLVSDTTSRYRHLRRVDYCSACSLLIRRSTWDAVGGFDEAFFPGYYEDLDLCLNIAALGQTILYQPRARLMHHGGGDVGSLDLRVKAFVARRSRDTFLAKWGDKLGGYPSPPDATPPDPAAMPTVERATEAARRLPLRALVVDARVNRELEAVLTEIATSDRGYAVTLGGAGPLPEVVRDRLGDHGVDIVRDLDVTLTGPIAFDVVVIAGRPLWDRWSDLVRRTQPQAPIVFWATAADEVPSSVQKPTESVGFCTLEPRRPPRRRPSPGFGARRDVLASGDGRWEWLADAVMPRVREAGAPEARLKVAGGDGRPPYVVAASADDPPPRVVAATDLLAVVAATVDGVPVVTTPDVGARLPADLVGAVVVAEDADAFASALATLLTDRQAWERRRRAIDDVPPPDPTTAGRWIDVLDAARHARLPTATATATA